jgi:microcystin-dependent protein
VSLGIVMKKHLCIAAVLAFATSGPAFAGAEPFIGEVETFAFQYCPVGWAPLDGRLLAISQNTALFALLETRYGGDGSTTFALALGKPVYTVTGQPLLQCIALQGIFPSKN